MKQTSQLEFDAKYTPKTSLFQNTAGNYYKLY